MKESEIPNSVVHCLRVNHSYNFLIREYPAVLGCFILNLVIEGECLLENNGKELTIKPHDLFIYLPGSSLRIIKSTENYKAISLILEEQAVYQSSVAGILLQTLCLPMSDYISNLRLPEKLFKRISSLMEDCIEYLYSEHILQRQAIYFTVSLILSDLVDFVEKLNGKILPQSLNVNTVIKFFRLLILNYKTKHDISFYSSQLHITNTHLSRVVKRTTGKTVMDHINRMITMNACWMLSSSDKSINHIADELNFSDQASFSKFFKRQKGFTPSEYRNKFHYPTISS